jgi:hypothetical protein
LARQCIIKNAEVITHKERRTAMKEKILRSLAVLSLLAWALSGCGWYKQALPPEDSLSPQSARKVVLEYFPFNMSDFPGLQERLIQAIQEDFAQTYGRRPLEVRIGFPKALPRNLPAIPQNPRRHRTAQVLEEYIDQIAAKIESLPPPVKVVTTPNPTDLCRAYRVADELVERPEFSQGVIFRVRGISMSRLMASCHNSSRFINNY